MMDPTGVIVAFLTVLILAAGLRGSRLQVAISLGWANFAISGLNAMAEALAFGLVDFGEAVGGLALNAGLSIFIAVAAVALVRRDDAETSDVGVGLGLAGLLWKVPLIACAYCVLYLVAGALAYPHVSAFYADLNIPPMPALLSLQVARSVVFVLAVAPLLRLNPRQPMLMTALALGVLGGAAPLAAANSAFPDAVRLTHLWEVTISNALLGLLIGRLLGPSMPSRTRSPHERTVLST